jgi:hypothetical protein
MSPVTRAFARLLVLAGFGAWLFSAQLFPGNSRLYDAIEAGDVERVQALLTAGADPNSQSGPLTLTRTSTRRYMVSPLIFALRRDQPEAALALLSAGADPNAHDVNTGKSALAMAQGARMARVAQALRDHGAR